MSRRAISAFRRINGAMDGFFNNVSRCCADQIEIARHLADAKRKNRIAVGSGIHRPFDASAAIFVSCVLSNFPFVMTAPMVVFVVAAPAPARIGASSS